MLTATIIQDNLELNDAVLTPRDGFIMCHKCAGSWENLHY